MAIFSPISELPLFQFINIREYSTCKVQPATQWFWQHMILCTVQGCPSTFSTFRTYANRYHRGTTTKGVRPWGKNLNVITVPFHRFLGRKKGKNDLFPEILFALTTAHKKLFHNFPQIFSRIEKKVSLFTTSFTGHLAKYRKVGILYSHPNMIFKLHFNFMEI